MQKGTRMGSEDYEWVQEGTNEWGKNECGQVQTSAGRYKCEQVRPWTGTNVGQYERKQVRPWAGTSAGQYEHKQVWPSASYEREQGTSLRAHTSAVSRHKHAAGYKADEQVPAQAGMSAGQYKTQARYELAGRYERESRHELWASTGSASAGTNGKQVQARVGTSLSRYERRHEGHTNVSGYEEDKRWAPSGGVQVQAGTVRRHVQASGMSR